MTNTTNAYNEIIANLNSLNLTQLRQLQLQLAAQMAIEKETSPDVAANDIIAQIQGLQTTQTETNTSLTERSNNLLNEINNQMNLIRQNNSDLSSLESRNQLQLMELENKKKLVETRNRMLQVSQEKNVFRKKLINLLLALIVGVTVLILIGYMTIGGSTNSSGNRS